jgi:hypothetical protein
MIERIIINKLRHISPGFYGGNFLVCCLMVFDNRLDTNFSYKISGFHFRVERLTPSLIFQCQNIENGSLNEKIVPCSRTFLK